MPYFELLTFFQTPFPFPGDDNRYPDGEDNDEDDDSTHFKGHTRGRNNILTPYFLSNLSKWSLNDNLDSN